MKWIVGIPVGTTPVGWFVYGPDVLSSGANDKEFNQ